MKVRNEILNGDESLASSGMIEDLFAGYLHPRHTLELSSEIAKVEEAIEVIQEYLDAISPYVEEM